MALNQMFCHDCNYVNHLFQVIAGLQLILSGWAIYKTLWIRYAPDRDQRWPENELEYWFPPGRLCAEDILILIAKVLNSKYIVLALNLRLPPTGTWCGV